MTKLSNILNRLEREYLPPTIKWTPYVSTTEASTYVVYRDMKYKLVGLTFDKLVLKRLGVIKDSRKYIKADESECVLLVISTPEGNIGMEAKHPSEIVYH